MTVFLFSLAGIRRSGLTGKFVAFGRWSTPHRLGVRPAVAMAVAR
jgi:hypothetical protein